MYNYLGKYYLIFYLYSNFRKRNLKEEPVRFISIFYLSIIAIQWRSIFYYASTHHWLGNIYISFSSANGNGSYWKSYTVYHWEIIPKCKQNIDLHSMSTAFEFEKRTLKISQANAISLCKMKTGIWRWLYLQPWILLFHYQDFNLETQRTTIIIHLLPFQESDLMLM